MTAKHKEVNAMATKRSIQKMKFDKVATKHYGFKFNVRTDADIIAALDAQQNKQSFVKDAIRAYLEKEKEDTDRALYIYRADVTDPFTNGDYQMGEVSLCEYGDEWRGDIGGYLDNLYDGEADIRGEEALGAVRQNFGGLDPAAGTIRVVCHDGKPDIVYWVSGKLADWAA